MPTEYTYETWCLVRMGEQLDEIMGEPELLLCWGRQHLTQ